MARIRRPYRRRDGFLVISGLGRGGRTVIRGNVVCLGPSLPGHQVELRLAAPRRQHVGAGSRARVPIPFRPEGGIELRDARQRHFGSDGCRRPRRIFGIGRGFHCRRAICSVPRHKIEARADHEADADLLGGDVRPHDAGERVAIGQCDRGQAELGGAQDQLLGVRSPAQKREIAGDLQLGVDGHWPWWLMADIQPNSPCRYHRGMAAPAR